MAAASYTGTGTVTEADTRYVKWVGKTKGGKAITIEMPKALCISNPDWSFTEKNDTVATVQFEGMYEDSKLASGDLTEPWKITMADGTTAGNGEIVLGVGKFYVGTGGTAPTTSVGLTRGGGSFVVERELREINADDDPGKVEGRVEQVSGRPKLTLNALQWVTKVNTLYGGMKTVTA